MGAVRVPQCLEVWVHWHADLRAQRVEDEYRRRADDKHQALVLECLHIAFQICIGLWLLKGQGVALELCKKVGA
jgi:hypothetical protein